MSAKRVFIIIGIMFVLAVFSSVCFAADDTKLDLNTATVEELANVPGLDQELAEKIIELREENGEFVDMEELLDVEGITNNLLRALKQHVVINDVAGCNC